MNIIEAIHDPNIGLRQFLTGEPNGDLTSWGGWLTALRLLYGLPITNSKAYRLIEECTGRPPEALSEAGEYDTALFLTGRRSGKSRSSAVIAAYEAVLSGNHSKLAPGEEGVVAVISPSKSQSRVVKKALHSFFANSAMLQAMLVRETATEFELANRVRIQILAGDYKTVRGFTMLAVVVDEVCFFGTDTDGAAKSDSELISAVQPALLTTGGRLIAISSPYRRSGWAYSQWERYHGADAVSRGVLVWQAPSLTMNPMLNEEFIERRMDEDLAAARAEYFAEWRDDVAAFISRDVVEPLVVRGRVSLQPKAGNTYRAFADLSGGRSDAATLCITHRIDAERIVVDYLGAWEAPFDPTAVLNDMARHLAKYGVRLVVGDNYAAQFVSEGFKRLGHKYERSTLSRSELYLEALPRLTSGHVELLDDPATVEELVRLERYPRAGGRDRVDHPANGHDDRANALAGAIVAAAKPPKRKVGAARFNTPGAGLRKRPFVVPRGTSDPFGT